MTGQRMVGERPSVAARLLDRAVARQQKLPKARYRVRVERNLTVPMRDGMYIDQIDKLTARGDHAGIERLNSEYDVTIVGPSVAERFGLNNK